MVAPSSPRPWRKHHPTRALDVLPATPAVEPSSPCTGPPLRTWSACGCCAGEDAALPCGCDAGGPPRDGPPPPRGGRPPAPPTLTTKETQRSETADTKQNFMVEKTLTHYSSLGIGSRGPCGGGLPFQSREGYLNGVEAELQPTHLAGGNRVEATRLIHPLDKISGLPSVRRRQRRRRRRRAGPHGRRGLGTSSTDRPPTADAACETALQARTISAGRSSSQNIKITYP